MQYQHKATGETVWAIRAGEMEGEAPPQWLSNTHNVALHYCCGGGIDFVEVDDGIKNHSAWAGQYVVLRSNNKISIMDAAAFKANYREITP